MAARMTVRLNPRPLERQKLGLIFERTNRMTSLLDWETWQ